MLVAPKFLVAKTEYWIRGVRSRRNLGGALVHIIMSDSIFRQLSYRSKNLHKPLTTAGKCEVVKLQIAMLNQHI